LRAVSATIAARGPRVGLAQSSVSCRPRALAKQIVLDRVSCMLLPARNMANYEPYRLAPTQSSPLQAAEMPLVRGGSTFSPDIPPFRSNTVPPRVQEVGLLFWPGSPEVDNSPPLPLLVPSRALRLFSSPGMRLSVSPGVIGFTSGASPDDDAGVVGGLFASFVLSSGVIFLGRHLAENPVTTVRLRSSASPLPPYTCIP